MSNPPLTDEEISRKFGITPGHIGFETAKRLSRNRPDRTICDAPMITCPHCSQEFQWEDYYDVRAGSKLECYKCERTIYVESVDTTITVTLTTHPSEDDDQ